MLPIRSNGENISPAPFLLKGLEMENTGSTVCELSIVMPCLNEGETLETCIRKAQQSLADMNIVGEVVIADNGSTDDSQEIACRAGAVLVHVSTKGYGAALTGGIAAARGKFIIIGDADDSYDFTRLGPFVEKLRQGYDLVMGNRFKGGIAPNAMPPLHRYLGNPVLTAIGRLFFHSPSGDFHCGLRGFRKEAALKMNLRTSGMEFASEMVVKATLHKMKIAEVPTTLSPDGRSRPPHLRSWRDGWRHLRFLLLYSPRWLFLYPGLIPDGTGTCGRIVDFTRAAVHRERNVRCPFAFVCCSCDDHRLPVLYFCDFYQKLCHFRGLIARRSSAD